MWEAPTALEPSSIHFVKRSPVALDLTSGFGSNGGSTMSRSLCLRREPALVQKLTGQFFSIIARCCVKPGGQHIGQSDGLLRYFYMSRYSLPHN